MTNKDMREERAETKVERARLDRRAHVVYDAYSGLVRIGYTDEGAREALRRLGLSDLEVRLALEGIRS